VARIRYIKPEFFSDTQVADLSVLARLLYIGLWCHLDRQGVCEDDMKLLKREIFPYDDDITTQKIELLIDELISSKRLYRFSYGGKNLLFCPYLEKHQKFHPKENHKYMIPADVLFSLLQATGEQPASNLLATVEPLASRVGNGEWGMGNHNSDVSAEADPSPPEELRDELLDPYLAKVRVAAQRAWLSGFQDAEWVKSELKKAVMWMSANPKRAPRSDFAKFFNNWLNRGWENYRKSIPSTKARTMFNRVVSE